MPTLFNREYSAAELKRLMRTLQQVAGIRLFEYAEGKARGLRAADVWTGSGLRFTVWLDRAMDLGAAEHNGRPLAWLNPALATAAHYEPEGYGWMRTWGGGLVTTCGLTHFGQPEVDGAERLGLHGRISHQPGENIHVREEWRGDNYVLEISGQVRQLMPGGENLVMTRRITTALGANAVRIDDRIVNEGFQPTPHMILYHLNFGFPIVSPESEVLVDEEEVRPRDEAAARGLGHERQFEPPQSEYPEQVFFHRPRVDPQGYSHAAIVNRPLGFGAYVRYRARELPYLGQWKQMRQGAYVCALEPANYWETPRWKLREEGRLRMLAPGEVVEYALELGALTDDEAIARFENQWGEKVAAH